MKSKFERKLKNTAYASVPDRWEEINNYSDKEMPPESVKRNLYKPYIAIAACLCVTVIAIAVFIHRSPANIEKTSYNHLTEIFNGTTIGNTSQNESSLNNPSDSTVDTENETQIGYFYIPFVLWGDNVNLSLSFDNEESELESYGERVRFHYKLADMVEGANPHAEIAVVVKVNDAVDYYKKFPQLVENERIIKDKLDKTADRIIAKYMSEENLSYSHAYAKLFKNSEFVKAREEHFDAVNALESAVLLERYNNHKGAIDELKKHSLTVLYVDSDGVYLNKPADVYNEDYQPYLAAYDAVAIMLGTKQELSSLESKELNYSYTFYSAAKNAHEFEYTDKYSYSEVELSDDSNISLKLLEAFENSNGKPLRVEVSIGYYGEELTVEEIEEAAFSEIGMTREEYEANATLEDVDRYREAVNRLTYHTDYYEAIAGSLFKNGEVAEVRAYEAVIIADLTSERANEILDNKEIVYICLENEKADNAELIIGDIEI